ncbi:hypothetical protein CKO15_06710 [Halorhodospira abdelmalekii]|uniref:methyl-accepting chemotaxis protein n=1 Tax=Halorhodospira abdelmalekii TaxID=421629 RepID=UPI001907514A|nr:methyl-accepting chemotaxis protein [Halorhodospira abdelmalekii]MBK1734978.1 hypothetical protein [Halorhodospira abdelmalekii]
MQLLRRWRVGARLWAVLIAGGISLVVLGTVSLYTAYGLLLEERQRGVVNVVEAAVGVVAYYGRLAAEGELTTAEAQQRAATAVDQMRYHEYADGSREYIWINDLEPRVIMHPDPEWIGQVVGEVTDAVGNRFFMDFVEVARDEGGGYVEYFFPMPGEEEPTAKVSYVELYEPWGWVIGSGIYMERGRGAMLGFAANFAGLAAVVLALLAAVIFLVVRSIVGPLRQAKEQVEAMTGETVDLTHRLTADGADEIADVARSINALTATCSQALRKATATSEELRQAADSLMEITAQASEGIERQARETDEVATAMNEMVSTVQEVARNTQDAAGSARQAEEETGSGRQAVTRTIDAIQDLASELERSRGAVEQLSGESQRIREILGAINEITEQTNLLSLNAAIEAARAGDSGRGFAVVADEVRKLSSRTHESTRQIQEIAKSFDEGAQQAMALMASSTEKANATVEGSSQAGDSLNAITQSVAKISELGTQIASAAEEQAATAEEINRNVVNIRDEATATQRGVEAVSEAAKRQHQLVEGLQTELSRIRYH